MELAARARNSLSVARCIHAVRAWLLVLVACTPTASAPPCTAVEDARSYLHDHLETARQNFEEATRTGDFVGRRELCVKMIADTVAVGNYILGWNARGGTPDHMIGIQVNGVDTKGAMDECIHADQSAYVGTTRRNGDIWHDKLRALTEEVRRELARLARTCRRAD
jgi:hypothetical protein